MSVERGPVPRMPALSAGARRLVRTVDGKTTEYDLIDAVAWGGKRLTVDYTLREWDFTPRTGCGGRSTLCNPGRAMIVSGMSVPL